jgi:hypothetical protein
MLRLTNVVRSLSAALGGSFCFDKKGLILKIIAWKLETHPFADVSAPRNSLQCALVMGQHGWVSN